MTAVAWSAKANCLSPARDRPAVQGGGSPPDTRGCFPNSPPTSPMRRSSTRSAGLGDPARVRTIRTRLRRLGRKQLAGRSFGQFVAHNITADRSALQSHVNPATLRNARAPRLDLECLLGDGPVGHPFLFQRSDPAKFLLGANDADVPRNADGIAIIGDPRNDSHMLMAQIHLAMLKAHNAFVDAAP